MARDKEQAIIEIILKGQQANSSLKDMEKSAKALSSQLKNLPKDSQAFADKKAEFQKMSKSLKGIQDDVKGVGGVFQSISKEIKGFGILAVGYLGFDWLKSSITGIIKNNAELSDSLADIRKTTGMTEAEARKLNTSFGQINTRTAAKELRNIAIVGGQLGIAKNDIFGFTVAVDKMNVALGDEFGGGAEEVTKAMGGLRNIFADIKTDKVDQDLLHIGNAINELASNGAATGPVVSDFANRIGGVGITLGLTSGQVLGLSATLQELNVSTERGGTAVTKILQKMTTNTTEFAKVAKMPVKEFTELVNKDLYGAFVKVVEGSKQGGTSATAFGKILNDLGVDGAGASEVFAKLGTNTKMLGEKVEMAKSSLKGTNSIMSEFNIKNQTLGADMERISKGISTMFTNSSFSDMLKSMTSSLAEFFSKSTEAEKLTDAWRTQKASVEELESSMVPLLHRHDELKGKSTLSKDEQKELEKIIAKVAETIPFAVTEFDKYGKAMDINTSKGRDFIKMESEKLEVLNKDALTSRRKELIEITNLVGVYQKALTNRDGDGDLFKVVTTQKTFGKEAEFVTKNMKLTNAEIINLQLGLQGAKDKQLGIVGVLNELRGISINSKKAIVEEIKKTDDTIVELDSDTKKKLKDAHKKYIDDLIKLEEEFNTRHNSQDDKAKQAIYDKYKVFLAAEKEGSEAYKNLIFKRDTEIEEFEYKKRAKYLSDRQDANDKIKRVTQTSEQNEIDDVNKKFNELTDIAVSFEIDTVALEEARQLALLAVRDKYNKVEIDETKAKNDKIEAAEKAKWAKNLEYFNLYHQSVSNVLSAYSETQKNMAENSSKDVKLQSDKDLAANKRLLSAKIIGQGEYNRRNKLLEEKARRDISEIKKKAAENDKKIAIFNALINAGVAISRAFKDYPFVVALPIAALAGASAMLQVSAISSAPVPEYAKGGFNKTSDDPQGFTSGATLYSNSSSGKPFIAGEAGKEWIAPNWMLQNPVTANTIDMLEAVRTRGFASGGSTSTKTPKFESTNKTANQQYLGNGLSDLTTVVSDLNSTLQQLKAEGIPAYINYDLYVKTMNSFDSAKASAQVKN